MRDVSLEIAGLRYWTHLPCMYAEYFRNDSRRRICGRRSYGRRGAAGILLLAILPWRLKTGRTAPQICHC